MQTKKVQYKMENKEFRTVCVKNRTCYYFDDITKLEDFDSDNIFIDEKSHKKFLIYGISCKSLIDSKPLHVRLDKIDGFIRIYDGTRYLTMFGSEKYDAICDGIRYFISLKCGMTYIFSLTILQKSKLILMIFYL